MLFFLTSAAALFWVFLFPPPHFSFLTITHRLKESKRWLTPLTPQLISSENTSRSRQRARRDATPHAPCKTSCQRIARAPRRGLASSAGRRRSTAAGAWYLREAERYVRNTSVLGIAPGYLVEKKSDAGAKSNLLKGSNKAAGSDLRLWLLNGIFNLITERENTRGPLPGVQRRMLSFVDSDW